MVEPLKPFEVPLDQEPHGLAGRLVVVDGVDGSGKSTLAAAIATWVQDAGHRAQVMDLMSSWVRQHPQFQVLADDLDAVVTGRADIGGLCAMCIGDRLATWRTRASHVVADGTWLIVDRYSLTSLADLHVLGSSVQDRWMVKYLLERLPRPDLTFVADCPPGLTVERVRGRPEEMHKTQRRRLAEGLVEAFGTYGRINGAVAVDTSGEVSAALAAAAPSLDRLANRV